MDRHAFDLVADICSSHAAVNRDWTTIQQLIGTYGIRSDPSRIEDLREARDVMRHSASVFKDLLVRFMQPIIFDEDSEDDVDYDQMPALDPIVPESLQSSGPIANGMHCLMGIDFDGRVAIADHETDGRSNLRQNGRKGKNKHN